MTIEDCQIENCEIEPRTADVFNRQLAISNRQFAIGNLQSSSSFAGPLRETLQRRVTQRTQSYHREHRDYSIHRTVSPLCALRGSSVNSVRNVRRVTQRWLLYDYIVLPGGLPALPVEHETQVSPTLWLAHTLAPHILHEPTDGAPQYLH